MTLPDAAFQVHLTKGLTIEEFLARKILFVRLFLRPHENQFFNLLGHDGNAVKVSKDEVVRLEW